MKTWTIMRLDENNRYTYDDIEGSRMKVARADKIIERLENDKFIIVTDSCGHSGKLSELPAIKKLIEELR